MVGQSTFLTEKNGPTIISLRRENTAPIPPILKKLALLHSEISKSNPFNKKTPLFSHTSLLGRLLEMEGINWDKSNYYHNVA